jgi:autotransporter-associated beta strand protein
VDIPFGILEMADAGAWTGKRGTEPNQIIEIGGVAGVAGSRLLASVAGVGGEGLGFEDVTYHLGGADEDVEFFGNVIDNAATDNVTVVKVGDNTQTFAGTNNYSGTTTINGGTLRVNGTHQQDATLLLPIGDYTVNSGGTLGGTGTIGSAADPVAIINNGGTIAPGASVGTLTVNGNVTFGTGSSFDIEVNGAMADQLAVTGNLDLTAMGNVLNVTGSGSGSWVIATYTGTRTGAFETIPNGLSIDYGTGTNSQITIMGTLSAILAGDYNDDGRVDAGDYVRWRNALAGNGTIDNETVSIGTVDGADYTEWKNNYGNPGSGGGGLTSAVPEPTSVVLLALGGLFLGLGRRRG